MMRRFRLLLIMFVVFLLCLRLFAEEETLTARQIGQQVDVLQAVTNLDLDKDQIRVLAAKAAAIRQKQDEAQKREDAILEQIKEPLKQLRDKLAAGEPVPESISNVTQAKLEEMQTIRAELQKEILSAASAVSQLMTEKQISKLIRDPATKQRAAEMVSVIRSASDVEWAAKLKELTDQLLETKRIDKEYEWSKSDKEKLAGLKDDELEKAKKQLEKEHESELEKIRSEIEAELNKIRAADRRLVPIAISNLCSYLKPRVEARLELLNIITAILSNPSAEAALNQRLAHLSEKVPPSQ